MGDFFGFDGGIGGYFCVVVGVGDWYIVGVELIVGIGVC